MRILQVCNVGNICGGTAACAWTITHALADHDHSVIFLSSPTPETVRAFHHCDIHTQPRIDAAVLKKLAPDVLILHNTSTARIDGHEGYRSIQYHHSRGARAAATHHIACSNWLREQASFVQKLLYQPIPIPPQPDHFASRNLSDEIIIGRICTPSMRKWPRELMPFYEYLAQRFPDVTWEFVGVPSVMQEPLQAACQQRCQFFEAGFQSREHLWRWDAMLYHHPTLTESFGRTVAESMRAGCLPIVDARGGFLEQITHGETGFLCHDLNGFVDAIQSLQDRQRRRQMSQEAISVAGEKFSLEAFYNQFRQLLVGESTLLVQGREN